MCGFYSLQHALPHETPPGDMMCPRNCESRRDGMDAVVAMRDQPLGIDTSISGSIREQGIQASDIRPMSPAWSESRLTQVNAPSDC
jgi:hypothetical protein